MTADPGDGSAVGEESYTEQVLLNAGLIILGPVTVASSLSPLPRGAVDLKMLALGLAGSLMWAGVIKILLEAIALA